MKKHDKISEEEKQLLDLLSEIIAHIIIENFQNKKEIKDE